MNFTLPYLTNPKAYSPYQILITVLLFVYPVFALAIRHAVTGTFILLSIIFIFCLYRANVWFNKNTWNREAIAFAIAMASPTFAVMLSQIMRMDFAAKPYDDSLRFMLAIPVYLGLRSIKIPIVKILEYAFPIGALLAYPFSIYVEPDHRVTVWFLNSIHYGNIVLILGLFSLFAFRWDEPRPLFLRILQVMGLIAGIYLSILSGTRGGWIALLPLMFIWFIYQNKNAYRLKNMLFLGVIFILIGMMSYLFIDIIQIRLNEIFNDASLFLQGQRDTSVGTRIQIWQVTLRLFLENPLFGIGTANYHNQLKLLGQAGIISHLTVTMGIAEVHQQVLSYAVKFGILGAISMLAIHFVPLLLFIRNSYAQQSSSAELLGILVAVSFFIFGLTIEIFIIKATAGFYSLTIAALLGASYAKVHENTV